MRHQVLPGWRGAPGDRPVTRRTFATFLLGCSACFAVQARAAEPTGTMATEACLAAIHASEVAHAIPSGLLLAIGRVESGRPALRSGLRQPWPWTVNADGRGVMFETAPEAVAFVADALSRGAKSTDTGCMQVNLQSHPEAFATLAEAFDPRQNADYAGRFLAQLHRDSGDWGVAVGFYHSHTPDLAQSYRQLVDGRPGGPLVARAAPPPTQLQILAAAWASTLPHAVVAAPASPVSNGTKLASMERACQPSLDRPRRARSCTAGATRLAEAGQPGRSVASTGRERPSGGFRPRPGATSQALGLLAVQDQGPARSS